MKELQIRVSILVLIRETKSRADIYAQVLWAKRQVMTRIGRLYVQPLKQRSAAT